MKRLTHFSLGSLILISGLVFGETNVAIAQQTYEITITNITRGQLITPPVVIAHHRNFELFSVGSPAIPELVELAEDGVTDPLAALLETLPEVNDFTVSTDPIPPGESITIEVNTQGNFNRITAVGMLATTNDAIFAVQGIRAPQTGYKTTVGYAYDAGSETNNESCDFIPGPPCENPFVRDTSGAEGFVHIHSGIHGSSDLDPAEHDWRNPVAKVKIQKVLRSSRND